MARGVRVQEFQAAALTLARRSSPWGLTGHGRVYVARRLMERDPLDPFPLSPTLYLEGSGGSTPPLLLPQNTNTGTGCWRGRKPPCHMADGQLRSNLSLLVTANRSRSRIIWWAESFDRDKFDVYVRRRESQSRYQRRNHRLTLFPLLECRSIKWQPNCQSEKSADYFKCFFVLKWTCGQFPWYELCKLVDWVGKTTKNLTKRPQQEFMNEDLVTHLMGEKSHDMKFLIAIAKWRSRIFNSLYENDFLLM